MFRSLDYMRSYLQLLPQEQAPWKEKKGNKWKGVLSYILYRDNACFSLCIHLISSLAMAIVQEATQSIHWDELFTGLLTMRPWLVHKDMCYLIAHFTLLCSYGCILLEMWIDFCQFVHYVLWDFCNNGMLCVCVVLGKCSVMETT